jgi:hypothetical protein
MPGGALATLGAPGVGGEMPQDPRAFQELLNKLRAAGVNVGEAAASTKGKLVAGLGVPTAYGLGSMAQGDITRGIGEIGGGVVGAGLVGGIASGLEKGGTRGKLAGALVRAGGGLIGGGVGGGIAGGVANAATGAVQAITGQRKEEGKSGLTGGGVGLSNLTGEQRQIAELMRMAGVNIPVEQAQAMMPIANQMKDADMQRQMQLNQQLGQLTGALNRQQYAFQLAGGAQAQAGENLRTMMTSNPYASSTFRY